MVRVSGKGLMPLAKRLCGKVLRPREATYTAFLDADGTAIDFGLALYFAAPHSFTGEDVLELQAHGGPVVLQLLLARCLSAACEFDDADQPCLPCLPHLRLAHPGEFSERAFLNDKIDLTQAEAIADLIDASTEAAARSASRSLAGEFSQQINRLQGDLTHLRTHIEAALDFPDEDFDPQIPTDAVEQLGRLQHSLDALMQKTRQGVLLREGLQVVIAGQPNVGKSSLLNALAAAELAIVTPIAGTTRDVIQQTIQIDGIPIHVKDTAGLRSSHDNSADLIEQIGMARTHDAVAQADVVLFIHDLTRLHATEYAATDADLASHLAKNKSRHGVLVDVWNKADAAPPAYWHDRPAGVVLSAKTGDGLENLRQHILQVAGRQPNAEGVLMARVRHVQALEQVKQHLERALSHLMQPVLMPELLAEELRLAQNALAEITGALTPGDLLGVIFSQFCIGK